MNHQLVQDPADLFAITEGDVEGLERFAETSAKKLVSAIHARKRIALERFLYALSIPQVGEETAIDLAQHFGSLDKIAAASEQDLQQVRDVGPKVAAAITQWFNAGRNREFVRRLFQAGVTVEAPKRVREPLKGKVFVLTGSLEQLTRDEAKEKIRSLGGGVSESVSKGTDYVVVGTDPGSKYDRAKELGVAVIDEQQFLKLIK
ncbi:MAG: hypothetical protein HY474_00070 [Candidatus Sungbacteria bacterium]|uniref:BRCT domain-containing protein n=1 Tax=Candidatus Sungiibacteriota bacterium TaxID=2750080 RepID=A0A933DSM3_9BACT|nr:hypothetical protein [Candidatus Sungbacteria bacterium]